MIFKNLKKNIDEKLAESPVLSGLITGGFAGGFSLSSFLENLNQFGDDYLTNGINLVFHIGVPIAIGFGTGYAVKRGKEADRDSLTGLHSRNWFKRNIKKLAKEAKKYKIDLALVYIDATNFGDVNNEYGDDTGDKVLKSYAHVISGSARSRDKIIRMGGDEVLMIAWDIKPKVAEKSIKNRLDDRISMYNRWNLEKDIGNDYNGEYQLGVRIAFLLRPHTAETGIMDDIKKVRYEVKEDKRNNKDTRYENNKDRRDYKV